MVSAALRDAVAGRVRASFAELGGPGLGTVRERSAEAAIERWRQTPGEANEAHDEPANLDDAAPLDSYDGTYAGMATTRPDGRVVTSSSR